MEAMNQVAGGDARIVELEAALAAVSADNERLHFAARERDACMEAVRLVANGDRPESIGGRIGELLQSALAAKDAEIERLRRTVSELGEQLEFDRTAVATSMTAANKAVDQRHWLTEGRGPYEWDDDRWHNEFYAAAVEIKAALEPLTKIAANWAGCPRKGEDVAAARIDWKQRAEAAEASLESAKRQIDAEQEIAVRLQQTIDGLKSSLREREARIAELEADVAYCPICGSCGEPGCCGVKRCKYLSQHQGEYDWLVKDNEQAQTEIESLRAQLEAAQKDTERLNWLAEQSECFQKVYLEEIGWIYLTRDAIDAARLPEAKKGGEAL